MNVKKFTAATTRDALRMVREEMGDEAVILSNRKVPEGIEIMAMTNEELSGIAQSSNILSEHRQTEQRQTNFSSDTQSSLSSHSAFQSRISDIPQLSVKAEVGHKPAQPKPEPAKIRKPQKITKLPPWPVVQSTSQGYPELLQEQRTSTPIQPQTHSPAIQMQAPKPVNVSTPTSAMLPDQQGLAKELKSMRSLLQEQFSCMAWSDMQQRDPKRTSLLRNLVNAGFSPALARQFLNKMPGDADMSWVSQVLTHNLHVATQAEDVVVRGGVFALTGPTGVGKTTTTAKLAARAVVRYGADSVALVTTDSYRIGALEQLRIYGKILGVGVHAARDTGDLRVTLSGLKHKHLVLIDTMGMGQRDKRVKEQADMFDEAGVQRLLMLNSTSSGDTLEDVVSMYNGRGVIGCISTKLDEAATLGAVLDVLVRHKLTLHYVANGQRVPEDLHEVNMAYLLHRAFETATKPAAFAAQELDIPAIMAGQSGNLTMQNNSSIGSGHAI